MNGHFCLLPDFSKNVLVFLFIDIDVAYWLAVILYYVEVCPFYP